jgi:glycerol uptake facilitator-like aquaporin
MSAVKHSAFAVWRRMLAELMGTALLVTVVGSGIAAAAGRIFSDTFAGIAPASALFFMAAQLLGGLVGLSLVRFFLPDASVTAGRRPASEPRS